MSTPNVELLEATMARILAEPQHWDQAEWACGTTRCFAGHAVELAGAVLLFDTHDGLGNVIAYHCVAPGNGLIRSIDTYAWEALGLTPAQAVPLFSVDNTLDDLHRMVKELIEHG